MQLQRRPGLTARTMREETAQPASRRSAHLRLRVEEDKAGEKARQEGGPRPCRLRDRHSSRGDTRKRFVQVAVRFIFQVCRRTPRSGCAVARCRTQDRCARQGCKSKGIAGKLQATRKVMSRRWRNDSADDRRFDHPGLSRRRIVAREIQPCSMSISGTSSRRASPLPPSRITWS